MDISSWLLDIPSSDSLETLTLIWSLRPLRSNDERRFYDMADLIGKKFEMKGMSRPQIKPRMIARVDRS